MSLHIKAIATSPPQKSNHLRAGIEFGRSNVGRARAIHLGVELRRRDGLIAVEDDILIPGIFPAVGFRIDPAAEVIRDIAPVEIK